MGLISKEEKPSTIMGVDCSSKSFAYSIFRDGKLEHYGEVIFDDGDIYRRMAAANEQMIAVSKLFGKMDAIYYEKPVFINNRSTVILLSYMIGSTLSPMIKADTQVYPTPVLTWQRELNPALSKADREKIAKQYSDKSKTWIKERIRQEHKSRGIAKVKELFDVTVTSNDVSDALLIGEHGRRQWQ